MNTINSEIHEVHFRTCNDWRNGVYYFQFFMHDFFAIYCESIVYFVEPKSVRFDAECRFFGLPVVIDRYKISYRF